MCNYGKTHEMEEGMLAENIWVKIREEGNNSDITMKGCYRSPNQTEHLDDSFLDQIPSEEEKCSNNRRLQ